MNKIDSNIINQLLNPTTTQETQKKQSDITKVLQQWQEKFLTAENIEKVNNKIEEWENKNKSII